MKRIMILLLAALLLLTGCKTDTDTETDAKTNTEINTETNTETSIPEEDRTEEEPYRSIDQAEAMRMMEKDDGHVIVDVRRQDEYEAGHIPGAILIPNESIGTEPPAELPDFSQIILIYCRSGNRSKQAAEKLGKMGYYQIYEFGGINTWPGEIVTGSAPYPDGQAAEQSNPEENTEEAEIQPEHRYTFQPKVCSVYLEEVFGKTMCETWYNLVDAVMAGKDTFACPDQHTYNWVMGQFPERCFPLLPELIDYAWDRENSVHDGIASFTYLVPPEEAKKRIEEFAGQIEDILNEALEYDYSDFEKVLALYNYFSDHYEYDYDVYYRMYTEYVEGICCMRFLKTGKGICQEISTAYSYLLMQAGVEATVMSGTRGTDGGSHQWSYVRINGKNYHVDPTYVICEKGSLSFLMMNDDQRERADYYDPSTFYAVSHYSQDNPHPDYIAYDDTFQTIWTGVFDSFSHKDRTLCFWEEGDYGERYSYEFEYAGY